MLLCWASGCSGPDAWRHFFVHAETPPFLSGSAPRGSGCFGVGAAGEGRYAACQPEGGGSWPPARSCSIQGDGFSCMRSSLHREEVSALCGKWV